MSFSSDVKEELSRQRNHSRHCQIAEAAAMFRMNGKLSESESGAKRLQARFENAAAAERFVQLLESGFPCRAEMRVKGEIYTVSVPGSAETKKILETMKLLDADGHYDDRTDLISKLVVQNSCCKRAFIRGAFLAGGSIINPEKSYHMEFTCQSEEKAEQLKELIGTFEIDAKIIQRKKYHVVYLKEGDQIVDLLAVMEANQALMNLENVRIYKEVRGSVNRKVNCDTANINKTVSAAKQQLDDIRLIRDTMGLDNLPDPLKAAAFARLENPEVALKELGELLDPPVGKSGINHRLKKLKQIADGIRDQGRNRDDS